MSIQKEEEQKQFCLQLKDIRDYKFTNTELAFYYLYKIIGHCKMNLKIEKKNHAVCYGLFITCTLYLNKKIIINIIKSE